MELKRSALYSIVACMLFGILYGPESIQHIDHLRKRFLAWDQARMINNVNHYVAKGEPKRANPTLYGKDDAFRDLAWASSLDYLLKQGILDYNDVVKAIEVTGFIIDNHLHDQSLEKIALNVGESAPKGQYQGSWKAASSMHDKEKEQSTLLSLVDIILSKDHLEDTYEGITKLNPSREKDLRLECLSERHILRKEYDIAIKRASPISDYNIKNRPIGKVARLYAVEGKYQEALDTVSLMEEEAKESMTSSSVQISNNHGIEVKTKESTTASLVQIAIKNGHLDWGYKFVETMNPSQKKDFCLESLTNAYILGHRYDKALESASPIGNLFVRHNHISEIARLYALEHNYQEALHAVSLMEEKLKVPANSSLVQIANSNGEEIETKESTTASLVQIAIKNGHLDWGYKFVETMNPSQKKDFCLESLTNAYILGHRYDKALESASPIGNLFVRHNHISEIARLYALEHNYQEALHAVSLMEEELKVPANSSLVQIANSNGEEIETKESTTASLVQIAIKNGHLDWGYKFVETMNPSQKKDPCLLSLFLGYKDVKDYDNALKSGSAIGNLDLQHKCIEDLFWIHIVNNDQENAFKAAGILPTDKRYELTRSATQRYVDLGQLENAVSALSTIDKPEVRLGLLSNLTTYYIKNGELSKAASITPFLDENEITDNGEIIEKHALKDFFHAQLATIYRDREDYRKANEKGYQPNYEKAREMGYRVKDKTLCEKVIKSIPKEDLSSSDVNMEEHSVSRCYAKQPDLHAPQSNICRNIGVYRTGHRLAS